MPVNPIFSLKKFTALCLCKFTWRNNFLAIVLTPSTLEGGEVWVVTFFVFEVPDYKSVMLIYLYIYICIWNYGTGRSFEPIFINSHGWCGSTHGWSLLFLEIIGPTGPRMWGKMCPQNQFFGFKSDGMGVFEKKLKNCIWYPIFQKKLYSFLSSDAPSPRKGSCPPTIIFRCYFLAQNASIP